jgi:ElaB/YqjD/DUF883 family membrane-anchored ribosome-binding protein
MLDAKRLATQIENAMQKAFDEKQDTVNARKQLCTDIANAIDVYVKQGQVNTVGVGTCPAGPVATTGTGSII